MMIPFSQFKKHLSESNFNFSAFCVSRCSMPQIDDFKDFASHVKNMGIMSVLYKNQDASHYRPTQTEYDSSKVEDIISKGTQNVKPIIVSKDGYVLDGHHRYKAALDSSQLIDVLEVDVYINELLKIALEYTSD